jgi:hypothetical protein
MRIAHALLPGLLLFLINSTSIAQSLAIGGVSLSLGDEEAGVTKTLRSRFHLVPVTGQSGIFFISERPPPNVEIIGGVGFMDGRVRWLQRTWGAFDSKVHPAEVSRALFAAVESASNAVGTTTAEVSTDVQRSPGLDYKTVKFRFGNRTVTVGTTDGDAKNGGQQVRIEENIRAP